MSPGLGASEGTSRDLDRILVFAAVDHGHVDLFPKYAQLFHRGGTINVGRGDERMAFAARLEPQRELGQRSGFSRALESNHHYLDGGLDLEVEFTSLTAHRAGQFVRNELDEVLFGGEGAQDLLSQRLLFYVIYEIADDSDVDVGFE